MKHGGVEGTAPKIILKTSPNEIDIIFKLDFNCFH